MTNGAGAAAGDLGSAGEFDASKSLVAGPDAYGSGFEMGGSQRVPDFYDDAGQPVYLGEAAGGGGRDKLKKILKAAGGAMGNMGGGSGNAPGGAGGQVSMGGPGSGGGNQFYVDRPWVIPDVSAEGADQVSQAKYKALMSMFRGAAGGL